MSETFKNIGCETLYQQLSLKCKEVKSYKALNNESSQNLRGKVIQLNDQIEMSFEEQYVLICNETLQLGFK